MAPSLPRHIGARNRPALGICDRAGKPVLHMDLQSLVFGELGRFGALRGPFCFPLCNRGPILQRAAALRRSSREMVEGDRPSCRAISRTP